MRKMINELLTKCKAVPFSKPVFYKKPLEEEAFYKVMHQQFKLPSGHVIKREFITKNPAAVVVPVTTDGNVVCVIQPVSLSAEGSLIEVPAGYAENNESSGQIAMRELVEETGYVPVEVKYLGKHYQDPGSIKEPVNVFVALGCERKHKQKLDKDEFIITVEIPKEEIKSLMDEGEIKDGNTFIALAKARLADFI